MAGGAAAAQQAAIANAVRAFGGLVLMEPEEFAYIVESAEAPLVVHATVRVLFKGVRHHYVVSHRGLVFCTRTDRELRLRDADVVEAKRLYMPV